jgi:hypothetical protein
VTIITTIVTIIHVMASNTIIVVVTTITFITIKIKTRLKYTKPLEEPSRLAQYQNSSTLEKDYQSFLEIYYYTLYIIKHFIIVIICFTY